MPMEPKRWLQVTSLLLMVWVVTLIFGIYADVGKDIFGGDPYEPNEFLGVAPLPFTVAVMILLFATCLLFIAAGGRATWIVVTTFWDRMRNP